MKILYYSRLPSYAPETSYFDTFAACANDFGHEALLVTDPRQLNQEADFIYSTHIRQPKTTDHIWIGNFMTAGKLIATSDEFLKNIRTWDNVATMAPSSRDWIKDFWKVCDPDDKKRFEPIEFALFRRKSEMPPEFPLKERTLCYCGVGWDNRGIQLLKILEEKLGGRLSIYGAENYWKPHNFKQYKGYVPNVINAYRSHAAVLVLHNPIHLRHDVITDRVHDAIVAGRTPIAPLTQEMVNLYHPGVRYFEPYSDPRMQAEQIVEQLDLVDIGTDAIKEQALAKFNASCCMDVLFPNLIKGVELIKAS